MSLEAEKSRIAGRVWQAIAQSDVNLSAVPKDQLEIVVNTITNAVMVEFDAMLAEMESPTEGGTQTAGAGETAGTAQAPSAAAAVDPAVAAAQRSAAPVAGGEQVLWEGRPFMSLRERYVVTTERVRIITGLVGRNTEDIEFIRLKDVDHTQGIGERVFNIGDIQLRSADPSRPLAILNNVAFPDRVHEIIRRAMLDARKRYPFVFEQEM
jgi:hypothetical protein